MRWWRKTGVGGARGGVRVAGNRQGEKEGRRVVLVGLARSFVHSVLSGWLFGKETCVHLEQITASQNS